MSVVDCDLIRTGPPNVPLGDDGMEWPDGWLQQTFLRNDGQSINHWNSPIMDYTFRSVLQVQKFLKLLDSRACDGDEKEAWAKLNGRPSPAKMAEKAAKAKALQQERERKKAEAAARKKAAAAAAAKKRKEEQEAERLRKEESERHKGEPPKLIETAPPKDILPNYGDWPHGWMEQTFVRVTGALMGQHVHYWFSPVKDIKFRSIRDVERFLFILDEVNGDEEAAHAKFKEQFKPPAPATPRAASRKPGTKAVTPKKAPVKTRAAVVVRRKASPVKKSAAAKVLLKKRAKTVAKATPKRVTTPKTTTMSTPRKVTPSKTTPATAKRTASKPAARTPPALVKEGKPAIAMPGGWPKGWVQRNYRRTSGATKGIEDRYFYSPKEQFRFRSVVEVRRYLVHLQSCKGDETAAYFKFLGKPAPRGFPSAKKSAARVKATSSVGNKSLTKTTKRAAPPVAKTWLIAKRVTPKHKTTQQRTVSTARSAGATPMAKEAPRAKTAVTITPRKTPTRTSVRLPVAGPKKASSTPKANKMLSTLKKRVVEEDSADDDNDEEEVVTRSAAAKKKSPAPPKATRSAVSKSAPKQVAAKKTSPAKKPTRATTRSVAQAPPIVEPARAAPTRAVAGAPAKKASPPAKAAVATRKSPGRPRGTSSSKPAAAKKAVPSPTPRLTRRKLEETGGSLAPGVPMVKPRSTPGPEKKPTKGRLAASQNKVPAAAVGKKDSVVKAKAPVVKHKKKTLGHRSAPVASKLSSSKLQVEGFKLLGLRDPILGKPWPAGWKEGTYELKNGTGTELRWISPVERYNFLTVKGAKEFIHILKKTKDEKKAYARLYNAEDESSSSSEEDDEEEEDSDAEEDEAPRKKKVLALKKRGRVARKPRAAAAKKQAKAKTAKRGRGRPRHSVTPNRRKQSDTSDDDDDDTDEEEEDMVNRRKGNSSRTRIFASKKRPTKKDQKKMTVAARKKMAVKPRKTRSSRRNYEEGDDEEDLEDDESVEEGSKDESAPDDDDREVDESESEAESSSDSD